MIVTPLAHGLDLLKSDLVRSPGVHASDIYGDFYRRLDPKRYDFSARDADPDEEPLLMVLGSAWEHHFEKLLTLNGINAYRPTELLSPEGIAYSPDLIIFNGVTRLGEIKLTSMALDDCPTEVSNNLPPKFDKYLCQIKLYLHWLEMVDAWLAVLSIRQPWRPELRLFDLTFTPRELIDNHRMLMAHARHEGMLP